MTISTPPTQMPVSAVRSTRVTGWVVAAIAVQLMVTSMASAATTCSETIERTRVTRLSHCVAQAIRELVDQGVERAKMSVIERDGEPVSAEILTGTNTVPAADRLGVWLLSLPPPLVD